MAASAIKLNVVLNYPRYAKGYVKGGRMKGKYGNTIDGYVT